MGNNLKTIAEAPLKIIDGDRGHHYPKKSEFHKEGFCVFLNTSNVTTTGFDFGSTDFITQERDSLLRKGKLQRNDVVMTTRGTVGNSAFYGEAIPYDNVRINSGMVIFRAVEEELDPYFLYCFLCSELFKKQTRSHGSGSAQPQLPIASLRNIKIPLPKFTTQQEVAKVLFTVNAKIELNNRINKELEGMAKLLYDYWFVQFDFPISAARAAARRAPHLEGKPYRSSGGKMVYNRVLKREIPEGWTDIILDNYVSRIATGLNPRQNFQLGKGSNDYVTIKNISSGQLVSRNKCDKIDDCALSIINRRSDLQSGDILFTSIEPVGHLYLIQDKPTDWNINESVFTIRPNYELVSSEFLFCALDEERCKAYTRGSSAGSIHKGIRIGVLKRYPIPAPTGDLIKNFTELVSPNFRLRSSLELANQNLTELRNWLLPMLMNGQVTVT